MSSSISGNRAQSLPWQRQLFVPHLPSSQGGCAKDTRTSYNMPFDENTGIYSSSLPDVSIPDNLSIDQFLFDSCAGAKSDPLWLIDAVSGRSLTRSQARDRSLDIARGLSNLHGLGKDDTLVLFSTNEVDYATLLWGTFRLGVRVPTC